MIVVESSAHLGHHSIELDGGQIIASWESPSRVEFVLGALGPQHQRVAPGELDMALLGQVHHADYLEFLSTAWARWVADGGTERGAMPFCWPARRMSATPPTSVLGQLGFYSFAADCAVMAGTWHAAQQSAAIAQTAAEAVVDGARVAFALCRPPGHHASADQFGGYCYLNNAAVAAQHLRSEGASRVAVVDVDYHHGNGTQDIFWHRDDVLFCSIHADPVEDFPFFLGHKNECGGGAGEGFTLNMPLPRGTAYDAWSAALDRCLETVSRAGCDAMVVSLGVDAYQDDPISHFRLTTADFSDAGRRLAGAELPTVYVLEGGYAVEALGHNVAAVLDGHESALA